MANPTVNAGTDQTVNDDQPIQLVGIVQQGTYALKGVQWTQVSGPDCAMTGAASWLNQVFEVSAGTYVFMLTAYDILGNSANDTVSITVSHDAGPVFIHDTVNVSNIQPWSAGPSDDIPATDSGLSV